MKKILLASVNPYSFCYAVENFLGRELSADAKVDAANLYSICSKYSPNHRGIFRNAAVAINGGFSRFVRPVISGGDVTSQLKVRTDAIPALPATLDALRGYQIGDCKIGLAALSSAASLTTITGVTDTAEYGETLRQAWRAAHISKRIGDIVSERGYDEIYIFNGRHCYSRPFCDANLKASRVVRYEKGGSEESFILSNEMIQPPENLFKLIAAHDFSPTEGKKFYENRLARAPKDPVNEYIGKQVVGMTPHAIGEKPYVVFFTSSPDEFFALTDGAFYGQFDSQYEVAKALSATCAELRYDLVVRFHPHLLRKHPSWQREWDFDYLRSMGVLLLEPGDPTDSYALARNAHCALSPGSTLGFECSYMGIPNAIVGDWVGGYLGVSAVVRNAADVAAFLRAPSIPSNAIEGALRYGSFYRCAGRIIPGYVIGEHPHGARLAGRVIDPVRHALRPLRKLLGS